MKKIPAERSVGRDKRESSEKDRIVEKSSLALEIPSAVQYDDENKRHRKGEQAALRLLSSFCRHEGGDPATLKKLLSVFEPAEKAWCDERMPSCVRLAVGWEKTVNHGYGLRKRIASLRLLADDAETLIGVRAVACDSEEDLALPLIEACSHLHGLDATAAFAMAEDSASAAESSKKAVARFWPTALVF